MHAPSPNHAIVRSVHSFAMTWDPSDIQMVGFAGQRVYPFLGPHFEALLDHAGNLTAAWPGPYPPTGRFQRWGGVGSQNRAAQGLGPWPDK